MWNEGGRRRLPRLDSQAAPGDVRGERCHLDADSRFAVQSREDAGQVGRRHPNDMNPEQRNPDRCQQPQNEAQTRPHG
jgi:hypothetical protein